MADNTPGAPAATQSSPKIKTRKPKQRSATIEARAKAIRAKHAQENPAK